MTDLQNDDSGSQMVPAAVKEKADVREDEVSLADYLIVLWKRKYLILLGSLVPALIGGLTLRVLPRNYKITYAYDRSENAGGRDFTQHNYKTFLDRFYSAENTDRIRAKLPEYEPRMVRFETWPPFVTLSEAEVDTKNPVQLEALSQMKAQLLYVLVVGRDRNDILESASVIRDNFEHVLPLYSVMLEVANAISKYKTGMAKLEQGKFLEELNLKTNQAILARFKNVETASPAKTADYPTWQVDAARNPEYLPLEYQIQAAELQVAKLEENIKANEQMYNYYKDLAAINERLSKELKDNISTGHNYEIQDFRSFLIDLTENSEGRVLEEYLSSYIKSIDNRISASAPVVENPKISSISKGTARKSAIVFVAALVISVFAAFLLEGLKKSQTPVFRN